MAHHLILKNAMIKYWNFVVRREKVKQRKLFDYPFREGEARRGVAWEG